tara:strand:+ start:33584 stop:35746 length:2163 start_codon:yes stop_codon:yes gene_type:complete
MNDHSSRFPGRPFSGNSPPGNTPAGNPDFPRRSAFGRSTDMSRGQDEAESAPQERRADPGPAVSPAMARLNRFRNSAPEPDPETMKPARPHVRMDDESAGSPAAPRFGDEARPTSAPPQYAAPRSEAMERPIDPPRPPVEEIEPQRPAFQPKPPRVEPEEAPKETIRDVEPEAGEQDEPREPAERKASQASKPIGEVLDIAGSMSRVMLQRDRLMQCREDSDPTVQLAGLVGSQIKVRVGQIWLLASVRTQSLDRGTGQIIAEIDFLGEGQEEKLTGRVRNFTRGITNYPIPGAEVYAATNPDLAQIYASDGRANIQIGKVFPTKEIRAGLYIDAMLGKHFALLGSTGTGKSTSAALILHRICEAAPEGHIVMIDPHGEYNAAFRGFGELLDVSNLRMPYWLMNFEEHCEVFVNSEGSDRMADIDILARCLLKARSKNKMAGGMSKLTVDSPIPYLLSDLTNAIQEDMGKLDKATNTAPYLRVKGKIDEIKADPRYQFMFSGMLVADTMTDVISRIFRMPTNGKPISIIDVSGVPSEITSTVVAMLSRMVFDFAIWSRDEQTRPILLVCEEAHRYVPNERNSDGNSVGKILSRIAKEGRKYGISLGLITQRPSDLAEGVLSQCGTILSMRLNNERDQDFVKAAMPEGARGFLASIPALRNRECIVCGEGTAIPMRVTFDDLEERKRPASEDPLFSELWSMSGGEEEAVDRTVMRWRAQSR